MSKNIIVLGHHGYIGYPLTLSLLKQGHKVLGIDNGIRNRRVLDLGSRSLTEDIDYVDRGIDLGKTYKDKFKQLDLSIHKNSFTIKFKYFKPDIIIHLAQQPSAPWSMLNEQQSLITQYENIIGTLRLLWAMKEACPDAHLIKLGSMGEYGTPDCRIPEGKILEKCIDIWYNNPCPMKELLFPRQPNSFYHLSKVHDTLNIKFACDTWGLTCTDIMQGVVFGVKVTGEETKEELTRFDYDEHFGTVINRFCAQAIIDHPLTVYGAGGQRRGFLPLKDSIQCLNIVAQNPPEKGVYRTLNQFESTYTINELAEMVLKGIKEINSNTKTYIYHIPNPRTELEKHYYNPDHQGLFDLGYKPTTDIQNEIDNLLQDLIPYKDRVIKEVIMPKATWR